MTVSVAPTKKGKFKLRWVCPKCSHFHKWVWKNDVVEVFLYTEIEMQCDCCGRNTKMLLWLDGSSRG